MNKRIYKAQGRYGYIGIEEYLSVDLVENSGPGNCLRTVITGIKPQKLGRQIAELLNMAYQQGLEDGKANQPTNLSN